MSRTLLLALYCGVLYQIAGHRTPFVEPLLRRGAYLSRGDGANAIRPAPDILDAQPGCEGAAIPAGQRGLIVLRVDRLGNELGLHPLEILGTDITLSDIRYHAVD